VVDVQENVASDLLKGHQFDDVRKHLGVGKTVINVCLSSSVIRSGLNGNNARSGSTLLMHQEKDTKLSQCFPGRNVSLKLLGDIEERF